MDQMEFLQEQDIRQRINALADKIRYYNKKYYEENESEISDFEFDELLRSLQELERQYPQLMSEDSPTQYVGGAAVEGFVPYTHSRQMLSLGNVFSKEELCEFDNRVRNALPNVEYVVEYKIDGLSVSLEYADGKFVRGGTRGNGIIGEDVTQNLSTIRDIPKTIDYAEPLVVRGEVYIGKRDFEKLNETQAENGLALYANPRNTASGSLRQLDPKVTAKRPLSIFVFNVENEMSSLRKHEEMLNFLEKLGFKVSPYRRVCQSIEEVWASIEEIGEKKGRLDFEIDGDHDSDHPYFWGNYS